MKSYQLTALGRLALSRTSRRSASRMERSIAIFKNAYPSTCPTFIQWAIEEGFIVINGKKRKKFLDCSEIKQLMKTALISSVYKLGD